MDKSDIAKSDLMLCVTSVVKRATDFEKKKREERGFEAYEGVLSAVQQVIIEEGAVREWKAPSSNGSSILLL